MVGYLSTHETNVKWNLLIANENVEGIQMVGKSKNDVNLNRFTNIMNETSFTNTKYETIVKNTLMVQKPM